MDGWPIPEHARMAVEALEAGKHVACTVPKRYLGVELIPDAVR